MSTKIKWTDETWNPIIGCSKVSPGCKNCYAEKMAYRLAHIEKTEYYSNVVGVGMNRCWTGTTHFQESQLNKPLKWKKPRMIFVCSMGDLFHESVPFEWVHAVFNQIFQCSQHTFQILTKRPERMKAFFDRFDSSLHLNNVWLGVTAENQEQANKRIPILLEIPAKVRFVSVEPMIGSVDLQDINPYGRTLDDWDNKKAGIHWVICGGESGYNVRPMKIEWVRNLKNQCEAASVPFFFKQWHRKIDGSLLDGKEYKQMPN